VGDLGGRKAAPTPAHTVTGSVSRLIGHPAPRSLHLHRARNPDHLGRALKKISRLRETSPRAAAWMATSPVTSGSARIPHIVNHGLTFTRRPRPRNRAAVLPIREQNRSVQRSDLSPAERTVCWFAFWICYALGGPKTPPGLRQSLAARRKRTGEASKGRLSRG
jgi:hypothetical protein